MIGRAGAIAVLLAAGVAATPLSAATFRATLLVPADDARLSRARLERALPTQPSGPMADALKVALSESQVALDAAGAALALEVVEVGDAAAQKAEKAGAAALVADLPAAWLLAAADAVKLPLLNIGAPEDTLRQADCRHNLWHLVPSERMAADALAQFLIARRWTQVLPLIGPGDADRARSATVQASLKRYGSKVVAAKPFKLSADPRERELATRCC